MTENKKINTHIYYRLEVLRLMGFLKRVYDGHKGDLPSYTWELSEQYKQDLQKQ